MPSKRQGASKSHSSQELYAAMGYLAVQPEGDIYIYDVKPYSSQSRGDKKKKATKELGKLLKKSMAKYQKVSKDIVEEAKKGKPAGFQLKVLFCLGKKESEKDLDNMLKWFLDIWKGAIDIDDSHIVDIRALKFRLSSNRDGFIGFTIGSIAFNKGDLSLAQMEAVGLQGQYLNQGYDPNNLDEMKLIASTVMKSISNKVKPTFLK